VFLFFPPQVDLANVFALNPDVAPDQEAPQTAEAPLPSTSNTKTSKLPKVCPISYQYPLHQRDEELVHE